MGNQFDDSSIKSFFIIEAQEYINTLKISVEKLRKNFQNTEAIDTIQKTAHTLKGSAGMLRFESLSRLSKYIEDIMKAIISENLVFDGKIIQVMIHAVGIMDSMTTNISQDKESENATILRDNQAIFDEVLSGLPYGSFEMDDDLEEMEMYAEKEEERNGEARIEKAITGSSPQLPSAEDETIPMESDRSITEVEKVFNYSASIPGIVPTLSSEGKPGKEPVSPIEDKEYLEDIKGLSGAEEPLTISDEAFPDETGEPSAPPKPPTTPKTEIKPERAPLESDFFVPSTETAPLEAKPSFDMGGMSFLDMIPDLKESFLLEATDHIQEIDHLLLDWESDYKNEKLTTSLMRAAHSLKGSANTVGFPEMGSIAHRLEDVIELVTDGELKVSLVLIDALFEALDAMKELLKWIDGEEMDAAGLSEKIAGKLDTIIEKKGESPETVSPEKPVEAEKEEEHKVEESIFPEAAKHVVSPKPEPPKVISPIITDEFDAVKVPTTGPYAALSDKDIAKVSGEGFHRLGVGETEKQIVRVHINQLDTLMNLIGELVINRSKLDKRVDVFKVVGEELDFSRKRLITVVNEFSDKHEFTLPDIVDGKAGEGLDEFSALEFDKYDDFNILSRSLVEIGSDIIEIMNEVNRFLDTFDTEIDDLALSITRLQEEITRARMVPVGRLFRRFSRTVRDISNRENKNVQMVVMGEDTELDKTVIEEVSDPLMHLIRNAVSHGIESSKERVRLGKNKQGTVLLNAYPEGNVIVIEVEDDGSGLDIEKIKETAIIKGLLSREDAEEVSQSMVIDYIFTPGFTTTSSTTEISGRGIGLDVVRENILQLGGSILVQTEKNIGTRFIIKLPLTLAITQALMINISGYTFALPLNSVEETIVLDTHKMGDLKKLEMIEVRDKQIPFMRLSEVLSIKAETNGRRFVPAVILGSAGANAAMLVDELLGQEEIVVKRFGQFLSDIRYFSGATISGDGNVVLIIDPTYMIGLDEFAISASSTMESTLMERLAPQEAQVSDEAAKTKLLLVDDSISIRKFVGKLLENAGYDVDVAVDGLEALGKAESTRYKLIVTDLEMPRMHGYEFISELKKDATLKTIPVIVLTSRAGEKHRRKAMEKGADGYVVKPFNEEILLEKISKLL